jgi:hypothetical protein
MYRERESAAGGRTRREARGARRRTRRGPAVPPACASSSPLELPAIASHPPPSPRSRAAGGGRRQGNLNLPCKHKAPPQPGSRYGSNRLGVDGVYGDRNDHGDAHASATFHKPLRCTGSALALLSSLPKPVNASLPCRYCTYIPPTCTAQLHRSARHRPPTTDHRPPTPGPVAP